MSKNVTVQTFHPAKPSRISDKFGTHGDVRKKLGLGPHRGLDYSVQSGTPLLAIGSGRVKNIGETSVLGYFIEIYDEAWASAAAWGYIAAGPSSMSNVWVGIRWEDEEPEWVELGNIAAEAIVKFSVSSTHVVGASTFVSVWFKGHRNSLAVLANVCHVDRFTVKVGDQGPPNYPNYSSFPFKGPLLQNCWQRYWNDEL